MIKSKETFAAVPFMRQQRDRLSKMLSKMTKAVRGPRRKGNRGLLPQKGVGDDGEAFLLTSHQARVAAAK